MNEQDLNYLKETLLLNTNKEHFGRTVNAITIINVALSRLESESEIDVEYFLETVKK